MSFVIFWTDALIFLLIIVFIAWLFWFRKTNEWQLLWDRIYERPRYLIALMVLIFYGFIGFLDSIHFKDKSEPSTASVLDLLLAPRNVEAETSYSAPFALYAYSPEIVKMQNGSLEQVLSPLKYAGQSLKKFHRNRYKDIGFRIFMGVSIGLILTGLLYYVLLSIWPSILKKQFFEKVGRVFWTTLSNIIVFVCVIATLMYEYHILGTDKVGRDVFFIVIKSIRTGLVIGTVTTLIMLPFALFTGLWAGYFRGKVDDLIQYIYTTLSSIPSVLLIAAAMLSFQVKIELDPDLRLLVLCIILGVTNWTTLCRLLRGQTLKLRQLDFVQSAVALGMTPLKIIYRHILPNLMHIVIISVVLDFSGLVLAEAVLSYVGVGVSPVSYSWGNLINASRLELARDPIVWWPLCGTLALMFFLVFFANLFSDALQEAFDPKAN